MAESKGNGGGESLSLQTLIIAAAASALAAVVVSHVWKEGTVIAAAMTPVIVAITKELLARPMESELVRKPVQQVGRIASSKLVVPGRTATRGGTVDPPAPPPIEERPVAPTNGGGPSDQAGLTPMRTYGRTRRRPIHLKVALITGLVAFLIAAAVLTLPELLFGGAISSHHGTTLFGGGGGGGSKTDKQKKNQNGTTTQQQQQSKPGSSQTTPATPPPTTGSKPPKTSPTPAPQQQTTPQQTSPVPTTPTTPAP